jgi:protein TonB
MRLAQNGRFEVMRKHRYVLFFAALIVAGGSLFPLSPQAGTADQSEPITTPPRLIHAEPPEYPEEARKNGCAGRIEIEVIVKRDGSLGQISIHKDVPECPSLAESARKAAERCVFEPATTDGKPVEAKVLIPFQFNLDAAKQGSPTKEGDDCAEGGSD